MKLAFLGKAPPIQGGVSRNNFWAAYALAKEGHQVHLVTNAREVEYPFRIFENPVGSSVDELCAPLAGRLIIDYSTDHRAMYYIPWAKPYVTKLAGIATNVIEQYGCDLILGYYLEPYAVASYLASQWTGVPFGFRHAGSDVGRLIQVGDLRTAYKKIIQSADYVFATPQTYRRFLQIGVDPEKIYAHPPISLPSEFFHLSATPLDVNQISSAVRSEWPREYYGGTYHRLADKEFDPDLPTIGVYGKIDDQKGTFDLVQALGQLRAEGRRFNFLAVAQGSVERVQKLVHLVEQLKLQEVTWLLPFMPHWLIGRFIRTCTAVCFLERNFPVSIHNPLIPQEVLACGTCLVMSTEIVAKQQFQKTIRPGANVLVADPLDLDELVATLRSIVDEPARAREIGLAGYHDIASTFPDFGDFSQRLVAIFAEIHQDTADRRVASSVAEMQASFRLYVDDAFRPLFSFDKDVAPNDRQMNEQEGQALMRMDREGVEFFARSLEIKRRRKLQSAYPFIFQVVNKSMDRYLSRFERFSPARPNEAYVELLQSFGVFIEQCLAADKDFPSYAREVVRFERISLSMRYLTTLQDFLRPVNTRERGFITVELDSHPQLRTGIRVETFEYNIDHILCDLQRKRKPSNVQEGDYCFVFQVIADSPAPKIIKISSATRKLLSLCDGIHSTAHLISEMERTNPGEDLENDVTGMIRQLVEMEVLAI